MYRVLKSPLTVQLELTTGCNHKCIHCYNHFREGTSNHTTLEMDEIERIIANLKAGEVPDLLITGGEPMLYPDLMLNTFELAKKAGMKCSLNTNATLVTQDIAKKLNKLKVGVLTSILSFKKEVHDKITRSEGSFNRLIEGIKTLQRNKVSVSVNMVAMQPNINQIYETGKFVYDLGIPVFSATKVHPAQGAVRFDDIKLTRKEVVDIFDTLIMLKNDFSLKVESLMTCPLCLLKDMTRYGDFLLRRSCSAGKTGCTIGANGQLRSCSHADDSYGNAITEPIGEIWARLGAWRDGSLLPTECKECKYVIGCSGGCRMDCKFYGKIDSMDPYATGNDFELVLPQTPEETELISLKEVFAINPSLVFRSENFGEALIIDGDFKTIVNPDSAKLLRKLVGKEFSLKELLAEFCIDEQFLRKFFTSLYTQDIIVTLDNLN